MPGYFYIEKILTLVTGLCCHGVISLSTHVVLALHSLLYLCHYIVSSPDLIQQHPDNK